MAPGRQQIQARTPVSALRPPAQAMAGQAPRDRRRPRRGRRRRVRLMQPPACMATASAGASKPGAARASPGQASGTIVQMTRHRDGMRADSAKSSRRSSGSVSNPLRIPTAAARPPRSGCASREYPALWSGSTLLCTEGGPPFLKENEWATVTGGARTMSRSVLWSASLLALAAARPGPTPRQRAGRGDHPGRGDPSGVVDLHPDGAACHYEASYDWR